jgi:regulator of protease activity HflC (stomatin/prohibitin superfamily)
MIRTITVAGAVLSLTLVTACDRAADEQTKATEAQAQANAKIEAARKDAELKSKSAQSDADKKIAEAQANFMKMREEYRHSASMDMVTVDKKIADLDAKAKAATGKAKVDLDLSLKTIHADRDRFALDFKAIESATALTWDNAKADLDRQWSNLKALIDKA